MQWLTPFAYEDDERALHIIPENMLAVMGLPVTEENLRLATQATLEACKEQWPDTPVTITDTPPAKAVADV